MPINNNFLTFFVQLFLSFFYSFMSFFSMWGQLYREKKNIKITCKTIFISFSFVYLFFLLNGIYLSTTLTSTGAVLAIFLLEGFLLVDKSLPYSTSNKQVLVQYVIVFFPQKCLEICLTSAKIFLLDNGAFPSSLYVHARRGGFNDFQK